MQANRLVARRWEVVELAFVTNPVSMQLTLMVALAGDRESFDFVRFV